MQACLAVYCNNRGLEAHLTNWTTALILSAPEYTAVPQGLLVGDCIFHLPQKDHTVKKQLQRAKRNLINHKISKNVQLAKKILGRVLTLTAEVSRPEQ